MMIGLGATDRSQVQFLSVPSTSLRTRSLCCRLVWVPWFSYCQHFILTGLMTHFSGRIISSHWKIPFSALWSRFFDPSMTRFRHFQKLALRDQPPENAYLSLRQDGHTKNPADVRSKGNFSFFRTDYLETPPRAWGRHHNELSRIKDWPHSPLFDKRRILQN